MRIEKYHLIQARAYKELVALKGGGGLLGVLPDSVK